MTTLQLMRQLASESRTHRADMQTLGDMLQAGHPDSQIQRSIAANALTRFQRTLSIFRQRYPHRDLQMVRIVISTY